MRDVNAKFVPILQEVLRCRGPSDARRGAKSLHRIVTSKNMTSRKKEKRSCRVVFCDQLGARSNFDCEGDEINVCHAHPVKMIVPGLRVVP